MKKSGKNMLLAAMSLMLSIAFTACGKKDGAADSDRDLASQPAELTVFSTSGDSVESWNERFGNALKEKFPHYTINYIQSQKNYGIKEIIASGQTIDIYWDSIGGYIGGLVNNGMEFDMTDLIKKHNIDFSKLETTVADSAKQISGGKIYGVPVFNNNMVLYYNKDLFDKFGVPYPKDGMTWDEAIELGNRMTRFDGGKQYVGLSSSETHMLMMNQLSIPFVDAKTEKATIYSDERWKKLFETVFIGPAKAPGYADYMKAHGNKLPYRNEFLKDRDLAMFAWLSSIIFVFPDDFKSMNWDMVSLPTFKEYPGVGSQAYPTYFGVTATSKQKDAGMQVIKYLVSEEMQMKLSRMGVMPVLNNDAVKKAYGENSAFKGKNFGASFYNKFAPIPEKTQYDSLLTTPYAKTVPRAVLEGDMNTLFRSAEEETNKKIADAKGQ